MVLLPVELGGHTSAPVVTAVVQFQQAVAPYVGI
jgi:hypothetical protein